jgi:ribosomal protein S18 acetylase RimI-like enzyme
MPYGTPSSTQALMHAAGIRSLRASAIMAAGGPLFAALDRHSPGEWYLQAIAVESAARGSGVGRSLLDDAFVRAARAGCASLTLDVDATNVRARALYERQGLHVAGTSPPAVLLGGARVHRMAVALPGPL